MRNPQRLMILTDLRKAAGLSLTDMARACGLTGNQSHQTVGAWELGRMRPTARRRLSFILYLWDRLALRKQPVQFETVWAMLTEEWDWEPLSDLEWQRLTSVARPTAAVAAPALEQRTPFQAPALTPHFVGRAAELTTLGEQLTQPAGGRCFALVGMGGIGKTTLAVHLAHALRQHFVDGVLWARVATTNPLDIAQSWAQAYGYDYSTLSDVDSRAAALRGLLAEKQALLIFDDVMDASVVRALLPGSGPCVVLLTTRDHDVAATLHAQSASVAELPPHASLELLRLVLDADRIAAEPAAAQEICAALHHLPLAVEIAAQRLKVRDRQKLSALAAQLRDITARLNLAIGDQVVRASFLASWEILGADLRHVFVCCGCFAGRAFTATALAYVTELDLAVAEEALFSLVALSLLKLEEAECYRQHPLLADYAREQLGAAPLADLRLADYYLCFARQYQTNYDQLEPEWDNVMAGMEVAHRRQQWRMVLDYADTLTPPWFTRARYTQARQGYAWAVEGARNLEDHQNAAQHLIRWGNVCCEQTDYEEAEKLLQQGLKYACILDIQVLIGDAQFFLARIALERSQYERASELMMNCYEIREQLEDTASLAMVIQMQAFLAYRSGNYIFANQLCQQVLALQSDAKTSLATIRALRLLIDIAIEQKRYLDAEQLVQQAQTLAEQLHYQDELADVQYSLAVIYRYTARHQLALHFAQQARSTFEHMGNRAFLSYSLYEISVNQKLTGEIQLALETGLRSLALLKANEDDYSRVIYLLHLGEVYQQLEQPEIARQLWTNGLELAIRLHHPRMPQLTARLQSLNEHCLGHQDRLSTPQI